MTSVVQRTFVPAARLCQAILYCGGGTGENTTLPVKAALFQASWAPLVFVPTRLITVQLTRGEGVGVGG